MPSAYSVPMASDVLPEPDTPTTATVRHSGTSMSISRRLLCRAPRTPMTAGRVDGALKALAAIRLLAPDGRQEPQRAGTVDRRGAVLGAEFGVDVADVRADGVH